MGCSELPVLGIQGMGCDANNCSLAMAEMTTLMAMLYRKYTTVTKGDFNVVSPGVTARYEVFYDEGCSGVRVWT